jgi:hypothetical protein
LIRGKDGDLAIFSPRRSAFPNRQKAAYECGLFGDYRHTPTT